MPCVCKGCIEKSRLSNDKRYKGPFLEYVLWPIFKITEDEGYNDFVIIEFREKTSNDDEATKIAYGDRL